MPVCRLCGKQFASDEIGAHIIKDHSPRGADSMIGDARNSLKSVVKSLNGMDSRGVRVTLPNVAFALGKVVNALGVALDEIDSLQREVEGINEQLGDMEDEREELGELASAFTGEEKIDD